MDLRITKWECYLTEPTSYISAHYIHVIMFNLHIIADIPIFNLISLFEFILECRGITSFKFSLVNYLSSVKFITSLNILNLFPANVPILYPLKTPENTFGFLVFSGGIKWEHWPEMGEVY